ncbi:hypothetical protein EBQ24_10245 [Allofranklinella schreckenbergeri]|uniref:Plasmid recombination enzyme n=1 Tax=Allofranklinella schreckenbergeri TaxID=1076744 RepID=A0A3M6QVN7_9BURK|nr:MobV family relaxase [Allofranklinella schreckenbergeri]RMX07043.1 hypothetical protein EBQ24_10245 [Allofranklinella schreckenbergeri]
MKKFIMHRIQKYDSSEIGGALSHNLRTRVSNNVDTSRIQLNQNLGGVSLDAAGRAGALKRIDFLLEQHRQVAGRSARSDAILLNEAIFSASPEYIKQMPRKQVEDFFRDCVDFTIKYYANNDRSNLISAVIHNDEETPHLHVLITPVINGKFNSTLISGDIDYLSRMQTVVHEEVGVKYGMDRGIPKKITKNKHVKNRELQALRGQVKQIPTPADTEIVDTSKIQYPNDPTKIDFLTGRAPGILSQQRQIFDEVFRELEGANQIIIDLDSDRANLIKQINRQAAQLAVPLEFLRRQLQADNERILADDRKRQRERRREAVRRWEKKIRGAQERAAAAQATAQQKQVQLDAALCRVPELVQQATEAEREKLQQERERIRLDRQLVEREMEQARQALKRLEEGRCEVERERERYAQLSAGIDAQVEERLAERRAELDASLAEAEINERNLRAQRAALDAAQDQFNEEWEKFQDERARHGQQMEDWQSQYEAKLVDIRTREKIERVPRDAWIDDLPTAPVVERKLSPLPPRRGGGRGGPNPFAINKRPRPRR